MTIEQFNTSLKEAHPPASLSALLQAMWYDAKGDWHKAHDIAQDVQSNDGSLVHAYLHRKEGDTGNASYWYNHAKRNFPNVSLQDEWEMIVKEFLLTR